MARQPEKTWVDCETLVQAESQTIPALIKALEKTHDMLQAIPHAVQHIDVYVGKGYSGYTVKATWKEGR